MVFKYVEQMSDRVPMGLKATLFLGSLLSPCGKNPDPRNKVEGSRAQGN